MISNLVAEIPSPVVDSFDSATNFHHHVWYGLACIEVESLHICYSVIYMDGGAELTHISLSVISIMHINIVDVYNSTCPE